MLGSEHRAFDLVVVGGSYGAVQPLRDLVRGLPVSFPAPLVAVVHRAGDHRDLLPSLLAQGAKLPVQAVRADTGLAPGTVHIGAPSLDVLIPARGRLAVRHVDRGPARVSADVLFATATAAYGARVLAVVLSGRLTDGAAGVRDVRAAGGRVLVQAPEGARAAGMPAAALATGCVDFALPTPSLARAITSLVMAPGAAELFRVRTHPGFALTA